MLKWCIQFNWHVAHDNAKDCENYGGAVFHYSRGGFILAYVSDIGQGMTHGVVSYTLDDGGAEIRYANGKTA